MPCSRPTFVDGSSEDLRCSARSTSRSWTGGIIGSATIEDFDLTTTPASDQRDPDLELLLEAARRATWDALHGPRHLRSGRFHPVEDDSRESGEAAQQGGAADDRPQAGDRG